MINAIVLINTERDKVNLVGEKLASIEGVSEVYSVSGRFDLVAILRLAENEDLSDLITDKMTKIDGITKTESMIAFKTLSKYDLERMFGIGE
ncbi:MAG: Lrp/AsnC ligand binding domain-containing protein [Chitinispirillaceae bacterium]|nr:Lrp/AsnC ligand binding domain-containing protein [Chitinispirillaceae bacterium]